MAGDRVLAYATSMVGRQTGRTFPTCIAGTSGSCALLVELLLVSQQQIPPCETSGTLGALERFLFGMRALMALQVL